MAMKYISHEERRQIARELEKHHAIFERVWTMSRIRFSEEIPTAGVKFNKRGDCIDMFVNPEFWESLPFVVKCFVISHECMHISLDHGARAAQARKSKQGAYISNVAQDIVINHALVERYGFYRDDIDPILPLFDKNDNPIIDEKTGKQKEGRKYCWVDTVFPEVANMPTDENYEYYYVRLKRKADEQQKFLEELMKNVQTVDDHNFNQENSEQSNGMPIEIPGMDDFQKGEGDGKPQEGDGKGGEKGDGKGGEKGDDEGTGKSKGDVELEDDDFQYFDAEDYTEDFESVIDKLDRELSNQDKKKLQHFLEENEGSSGEVEENPDYGPDGTTGASLGGGGQGDSAGRGWTFAKKMKIKKRKFESIITSWAKEKMKEMEVETDQWIWTNRRFAGIESSSDILLPMEHEILDEDKDEDKIDVWFYQDTSGSCGPYKDRFFAIAEAMPIEKFNMRMFCFDTMIYETSLETRELKGFGGTHFHILENHIQEELANNPEMKCYPDAIFVVTDGLGTKIVPEKPENWHWILTPGGSTDCFPKTCNVHDLAKYE